ncbi:hypothetical protein HPB50_013019 [Hyalomma asiaticum]|uniref:Uncharacterized protein n=1 Tax=Hyalomma asiaticum TaxID=266040 RepID=A0ACB7T9K2_HYAAI|nr:hypothetical protein HPB50_013019 [Hyalomma asiaticum]
MAEEPSSCAVCGLQRAPNAVLLPFPDRLYSTLYRAWLDFVRACPGKREWVPDSSTGFVCSLHFTPKWLRRRRGSSHHTKLLLMNPCAVPTIYPSAEQRRRIAEANSNSAAAAAQVVRGPNLPEPAFISWPGFSLRRIKHMGLSRFHEPGSDYQETLSDGDGLDTKDLRDAGIEQTTRSSQCSISTATKSTWRTVNIRSRWTQCDVETVSRGTQASGPVCHDGSVLKTQRRVSTRRQRGSSSSGTSAVRPSRQNMHYECAICAYRCIDKEHLVVHMSRHTACRKSFKCEKCSCTFSSEARLTLHMPSHQKQPEKADTAKQDFNCDLCPDTFATLGQLLEHVNMHEKTAKCELCSCTFASELLMRAHLRQHTDEESYVCDACSSRFTTRVALEQHRTSHKVFKCLHCCRTFKNRRKLELHMRQEIRARSRRSENHQNSKVNAEGS